MARSAAVPVTLRESAEPECRGPGNSGDSRPIARGGASPGWNVGSFAPDSCEATWPRCRHAVRSGLRLSLSGTTA